MNITTRSPGLGLASARILLRHGLQAGLSAHTCLQDTGLGRRQIEQGLSDVTCAQELQMIDNLCAVLGNPLRLGFEVGLQYRLSSLGLIGLAMMTSRDLRAAAELAARYLQHAENLTQLNFAVKQGDFLIEMSSRPQLSNRQQRFLIARELGVIAAVQDEIVPGRRNVRRILLTFPYDPAMDAMARYFACPVLSDQEGHCFVGDAMHLAMTMPMSNPVTADVCEHVCTEHLLPDAPDLIGRVRQRIEDALPELPCMEQVAEQLHMSVRTLSRHLDKAGWRWRDLISECRLNRAEVLLKRGVSIKMAAAQAGFSSTSSFSHAFNRRRGLSPGRFAEQMRKA